MDTRFLSHKRIMHGLSLFVLLSSTAIAADTIYVSADAEPGGEGTKQSPFASLAEAESASNAGDSILLLRSASQLLLRGSIRLKAGQKLLGVGAGGEPLRLGEEQVSLSNQLVGDLEANAPAIIILSSNNEIAGMEFQDISNAAIEAIDTDYSGTLIHDIAIVGNSRQHVSDERGLVYGISLNASAGTIENVRIENSRFRDGQDLGAIRVFHSGTSRGNYRFSTNTFNDLGGRAYFVRSREQSKVESIILNSSANNIGLGDRNSDSIIPYLMGQSEQVMLIRNYQFDNSLDVGSPSNTAIEAYMYGDPRPDTANWCIACKLRLTILDSVIRSAVTDPIQFSNAGSGSILRYEIRNSRILGGNPQQGGGGISLNLQRQAAGGGSTHLLVENTDIISGTGYAFSLNDRSGDENHDIVIDFGGGALGSQGGNRFIDNAKGPMRLGRLPVSARNNYWHSIQPRFYDSNNLPLPDSDQQVGTVLTDDPRPE